MIITRKDIDDFEQRYRATFINSLAGFKQAFLIGTKSKEGLSNLAIFNSLIHIGANPPLWGFISRPVHVRRDTYNNILETGSYTINYVSTKDYLKAHQTSASYDKGISEFEACGFTEQYHKDFDAPFVAEALVKVAMKKEQIIPVDINKTLLIIGSIEKIEVDESVIGKDGYVALDALKILACAGLDAYFETASLGRVAYAKPFKPPTKF